MPSKPSPSSTDTPITPVFPESSRQSIAPWIRTAAIVALGLGMAGAVVRAGSATKFFQKRAELQRELRAEQQRLGLAGRENQKALYAQFPTPEITLCKAQVVAPGASAPVAIGGKFAEKTVFLAANDDVTLEGTLAAGKFTGTATVAAEAGPGWAPIHAIVPVSGANRSCGALFVGPVTAYEFKGDNDWTVKVTPAAKAFTIAEKQASLGYNVTFFKDGEAKPFKTMAATLTVRESDQQSNNTFMSLDPSGEPGSPAAELADIQRKMSQPDAYKKLGPAEFSRLGDRMGKLIDAQSKEQSAPGWAEKQQKEQDDFGCRTISFSFRGGEVNGNVSCGKNVGRSGSIRLVSGGPVPAA